MRFLGGGEGEFMTQKTSRENVLINIHGVVPESKKKGGVGGTCFLVVSLEANERAHEGCRDICVVEKEFVWDGDGA